MSLANCVVDDNAKKIIYDREAFPELTKRDFKFAIKPIGDDMERGEFEMSQGGVLVRYHYSVPFPKGALKMDGKPSLNNISCIIKLKKTEEINLNAFFGKL